ncbi:MAG: hypothetical protein JWL91_1129, partial [Sphingomonas bacterium]|nr:hypothetical protein [Sphingomonas bacterium]
MRAKALALMIELAAGGAAPAQEARQADPV